MKYKFYDIAIIGAGISGLYSGMRLARSSIYAGASIGIFEASTRLGGRIKSIYNPKLNLPCELGCMRYLKSQRIIANLIEKHYSLDIQSFNTGNIDKHIYYLRGNHVDLENWNVKYNIPEAWQRKSPFKILDDIINNVIYNNDIAELAYSAREWSEIKKRLIFPFQGSLFGKNLQDVGFANLISECSSYETLKFLCDSGEYYAKTINWNSSEALPYSQTVGYKAKDDIEYWCIKKGFDLLPQKICEEFQSLDGKLYHDMELKVIGPYKENEKKYKLIFYTKETNEFTTILSNKIILAIPKQPLKNIRWLERLEKIFYQNDFQNKLNSIRAIPVIRFALLFKTPWWSEDFKGLNGHMVTDLPLRHGYYFGSEDHNKYSVFLSTIDMDTTDYWIPYLKTEENIDSSCLPEFAINEIMRQLRVIHRRNDIESPICGMFANWNEEYYGSGFHAWSPGFDVSEIMQRMRKPFADEEIHIIGESFSGLQGWVEGPLCTVEKLLNEHFQIQSNEPWLESDYFYGY